MSSALRKLVANASKCNCTVIFINQLRSKVGVIYGSPEVTSGGNALKYYASVRIDVRRKETLKDSGEEVGIKVKASIKKNKVAPPYKSAEFDILFGSGISKIGSLLDAAVAGGIAVRKGAWYSYGETRLGNGREKAVQFLEANPEVMKEVDTQTRAAIAAGRATPGFDLPESSADTSLDEVAEIVNEEGKEGLSS
uniref:RecA family profile 2 domain-containing protein n=1 Tax=Tetraselmis chuii TaxID=63592 RepID=A0A7S1SZ95_9CHLO|mmetsp:Transcript_3701/g.6793  ORF Transcript_3701/g.6793 Transcript_3701/m.6793 type:complete len:195 (+) Transcript_3701:75-659(+)